MEEGKLNLDRCILFPREEGAVIAIENREIDSRYRIDVIDLSFSLFAKLRLFGFFDYPEEYFLTISNNDFKKVDSSNVEVLIETALKSRKQTNDKELLSLIDRFVEKAQYSKRHQLPIWFNT